MNNVERNHILKLLFSVPKFMMKNFLFIIIILKPLYLEVGIFKALIFLGIGIIVISIISFIGWYNTIFYFKEGSIFFKKGVISIEKREVPFNKINTVDISQNMIYKLFNLSQIKVDTGSAIDQKSEIVLLLKTSRAEEIRNLLLVTKNDSIQDNTVKDYRLNSKDLLIYTLTSNVILSGVGIIFIIINFIDDYINKIFDVDIMKKILPSNNTIFKVVWVIILLIAFSILLAIIRNFIKYYNFRVYVENDKLNIEYGMFNKKNYSFQRKKIKGIHIKQNLIMQKLNLRTIEVESIGYGDEEGEKAILFPICSEKLQNDIVDELLPEFNFKGAINKSPRSAAFRFMVKKLIFIFVIMSVLIYKFSYGYLSILLIPYVLILGLMQHKNAGIGVNNELVYMCYNGFNKNQSIIKMNAVQSFEVSQTYFQKIKGISNYKINIFSNKFGNSIKVCNLNYKLYDQSIANNFR